jgi:hypothetical protein
MKTLQKDDERAAIKLWKAQVPPSKIRAQLKMSAESDMRRILALCLPTHRPHHLHARKGAGGHQLEYGDDQILVCIDMYLMSFFLNHFVIVFIQIYMTGHIHLHIP